MEFLTGAVKVVQLLATAAPAAATIFKTGTDMYNLYKKTKSNEGTASGKNAQSEQLVQIKHNLSELKGMMKDPSKSTLRCQEKINEVDKKLDQMSLEASELKMMVEDLANSTMTGFERMDHAFSQVC
jgi:hypothetical protein